MTQLIAMTWCALSRVRRAHQGQKNVPAAAAMGARMSMPARPSALGSGR